VPYFDWNATAPLHPAARRAWLEVNDRLWHNPSSLFAAASAARESLEMARETLADLLGADPGRIVFTAGATEANNALARHLARVLPADRAAAISPLEHPCVTEPFHVALPGRVVELPVDERGVVDPDAVARVSDRVGFVSVMAASNESGGLEPWEEIARACRGRGIPFHTDAAQWLGRLPAGGLGASDWVTGSGHKFGGPKGCGFLVVPAGDGAFCSDRGGPQEGGRRAGTENVAAIVALVAALEACAAEPTERRRALAADRDAAEARLLAALPGTVVVGGGAARLWNTLALLPPPGPAAADARKTVARLAAAGVEASTGAACSAGSAAAARVVAAIGAERLGVAPERLRGMVRLSGGWQTTAADWTAAVDALVTIARGAAAPLPGVTLARPE
jgi:cysteine desulfurase